MNYNLMLTAVDKISPYLKEIFKATARIDNIYELLMNNQVIGKLAEERMLIATNGVNCYKGLIYNLGLMITASTYSLVNLESFEYSYFVSKTLSNKHLKIVN